MLVEACALLLLPQASQAGSANRSMAAPQSSESLRPRHISGADHARTANGTLACRPLPPFQVASAAALHGSRDGAAAVATMPRQRMHVGSGASHEAARSGACSAATELYATHACPAELVAVSTQNDASAAEGMTVDRCSAQPKRAGERHWRHKRHRPGGVQDVWHRARQIGLMPA